jgi:membrane fusion protein, multidrug efflux system
MKMAVMFKKRIVVVAVSSAFLCLGSLIGAAPSKDTPVAAASVEVVKPQRGVIHRMVTLPGEIKPAQQATLYAKVTGYLKMIAVDKGDEVKEGALIAEIEVPELLADTSKYKAEVELAEIDYKRVGEAQKRSPDLVTPLSVDTARGKYEVAKANLERAETLQKFTKITAPFAGIITRRTVDAGTFIPAATAGSPQSAALVTIADFRTVRVQVAVPEVEASLVKKDQPAQITVEGLPGRKFEGKVTRFSYALEDVSKTMLCEIELPNPKLELRPGMYATVKIGIERKENALLVPVEALVMEKANAFVFVDATGKAKKTPIKAGFNDGVNVEALNGLNGDERVIRVGKTPLTDGQIIKVVVRQ